ncbi:hypothetical protein HGRIS_008251 [Hohenbuehelia grisea]|uniref:aminodeoxychorismate synthase n=1 Tax=Hohenbuehelia grisea TaxID=104357 RepID=A0ABR3J7E7_9AGAR
MTVDAERPKLLLIDSYDSFTYNLASLFRSSIQDCSIFIIKNDALTSADLLSILPYFSAVVVGPGPGSPDILQDIGIVKSLWTVPDNALAPVFGVCLGLQSLALEHGAELKRLNVVKHGQVSIIQHDGKDLFENVQEVQAVRYHSLHVEIPEGCNVQPIAWADDGEENGRVVMAVKHRSRPFWAVQYHPESVCTHGGGSQVVQNFWRLAQQWARKNMRAPRPWNACVKQLVGSSWPDPHIPSAPSSPPLTLPTVATRKIHLPNASVTDIAELLGVQTERSRFVMLDSAANPGRFSIIASLLPSSVQITHQVGASCVNLSTETSVVREELGRRDIWAWIATFMRRSRVHGGNPEIPFWGGMIGFLSYELGVGSLDVSASAAPGAGHPDVNLIFVERSVVYDNVTREAYVQSLIPGDSQWMDDTVQKLRCVPSSSKSSQTIPCKASSITLPDKDTYIARIKQAKEHLFAGDSYELCLTALTRISLRSTPSATSSSSWERYKQLRRNNPAPHSAYIRLHPSTLLSSSPERFLSFSRPPGTICQLRPIKGTIRKSPTVTRAVAEKALAGSTKEVAENLMIVDLIRHDLHGVVGDGVQVKQFCKVEEYETVWQLVSVIEGQAEPGSVADDKLGWDVLSQSLPPGSMTGAPKKRSVEILQTLEDDKRGIYSGVFGYWCVGGGGDWSVTIRSCFKYDDSCTAQAPSSDAEARSEEWLVGAGGAITALSDPDAEWDEMIVKLQSVLRSFGAMDTL